MSFYDEIEIEDMTYHESTTLYTYPCPCGDQFEISLDDLRDGEEVAVCPSCSLQIKVVFDMVHHCASVNGILALTNDQDNLPKPDQDGVVPTATAPTQITA